MQSFWLALQFLTRIPTPQYAEVAAQTVGRSLLFYPLVGLIIGASLMAMAQLVILISPLMTAALVLSLWLFLSGALHIDGLADMADAWVGGYGDRERTLAIMKDPYCGPMGVTVVVALLLLKFTAVAALVTTAPPLLLLAPLLGRSFAVLLMLTTPYCRDVGLASDMVRYMPRHALWGVLSLVVVVVLWWLQWMAVGLLAATLLLFFVYRYRLLKRLQGFTGDAAGALIELTEVVILLLGAGIISTR
jgi:adenosylcobinamide-GDP ribazoletransferase